VVENRLSLSPGAEASGDHTVAQPTDGMILTPYGPVSPHPFHARRFINAHREGFPRLADKVPISPAVG
jgi:hypothetical protein